MNSPKLFTLLAATALLSTASPIFAEDVGVIQGPGLIANPRAEQLPYGRYTCKSGYVWREAYQGDVVCVTPQTRSQAAYDNSQASYRIQPGGGAWGAFTCRNGYVWREASAKDVVCVTPQTRSQVAYDNSKAPYRRVIP